MQSMQNKKIKTEIIMYADGHKIVIENIDDPKNIVCDGDCENCPIADMDCDGDCEDCLCSDNCDESEAN